MGRHNGSWSPVYGQIWTHPKTARAAAWLVSSGRRVTAAVAPFLVIGWLNRLCLWCLANSERGSLAGLSAARLATIAWPEAVENGMAAQKAGDAVLGSLMAGGFLEGQEPRIHDFDDHHARILKERNRKRDASDARDGIGAYSSADRSAPHSAEQGAEHSADRSAEPSAPTGSGSGSGTGTGTGSGSGRAAAEALLAEVRSRIRWRGTDAPIRSTLDDWADAGLTPDAIRAALDRHATIGIKPFSLRDLVLESLRRAPKRPDAAPPEPCIDCHNAPRLPGRALCAACATPARERATQPPSEPAQAAAEAPERGFALTPNVHACSPPRPAWRVVGPPAGRRRRWLDRNPDDDA